MTRLCRSFVALALLGGLVGPAAARAEESADSIAADRAVSSRLADLEAEIATLRQQMNGAVQGQPVAGFDGGAPCGCEACCECCDCCCQPQCCGHWFARSEFVMLQPRWRGFDAVELNVQNVLVVPAVSQTQFVAYDYDYDPSARFSVGYEGCNGLGVRASWWHFEHHADPISVDVPITPFFPGAFGFGSMLTAFEGETFIGAQSLELETIDLEATNRMEACGGEMTVGFGFRFAKYRVTTGERVVVTAAPQVQLGIGEMSENFRGYGPTVALEFVRPLYVPGLSLYTGARTSFLFGEEHQGAFVIDEVLTGERRASEPLAIWELTLALQFTHGNWFAQAGWQAQYWDDVASDHAPLSDFTTFFSDGEGSNLRSDLGLQGFFVSLGAQY